MYLITTLEDFIVYVTNEMPHATQLIHSTADDHIEYRDMSNKAAFNAACNDFVEQFIQCDEIKVTVSNELCAEWLRSYAVC